MADLIVSPMMKLLDSIIQRLGEEAKLVLGVEEQVRNLTRTFKTLEAVLNDAECMQVNETNVRDWLDKLKDTFYDIDDVLDEWITAVHNSQQTMEMEDHVTKVCTSHISCYGFCYRRVVISHDIAVKIRDLNKKLDFIAKQKDSFNFSSGKGTGPLEQRINTSFIDPTEIHGRDHEKDEIKNLLLSENSDIPTSLPVISIVGMGGTGKTTLARLVFNDSDIQDHFTEKIWVSVSNPFVEVRIAKAILESLIGSAPNLGEYQNVLKHIQESIKEKKFLLVLDDVWTEDSSKWEQLKNTLKCGSKGSRILTTTRKKYVADALGTTNLIELKMLSDEQCWKLFRQLSLCSESKDDCKELEEIGRKIVGKSNGLPLAVKSLGTLLYKKTIREWKHVLNSEMWKLEKVEKEIFSPLLLSYYDLPPILKKCFLYCAIFPKDYVIEKDQLIQLWMAQDYLVTEQSDDLELNGEKKFDGLVMRSFFQDVEKSEYDGIIRCKMHHIMHDFAQFLTKKECFTIESDGLKRPRVESNVKARHVMVRIKMDAPFPTSIYNEIKLRSLLIDNGSGFRIELSKLFDQMTCLRSLDLSRTLLEQLPGNIKKLIHLRYLNLSSNSRLKQLPETLFYLYNLQTLNLSNCPLLKKMPEEIGRLTCLRMLNKIVVSGDIKACNFECLRKLNHLQGSLDIECRDRVDVGEINNAEFKNKENLYGLRLEFWDTFNEEAFEAFQPPPNLENLKIERYKGNPKSLNWMGYSLTKLKKLCLEEWKNLERLPFLGKLLSLETLSISKFSSIKSVHDEFLGTKSDLSSLSVNVFPKLKSLEFSNMYNWEEWDYGTRTRGEITIMQCLRYLSINYCDKLKKLPDYLLQLRMLEDLKICSCPQLNKGTLMSLNRMASLTKLRKLTLQNCENFDCLPPLGKMSCLESLYIGNMRSVIKVHNEFLGIESDHGTSSVIAFPKLESLEFRDMENWEEWDYSITQSGKEDITIMPRLVSLTIRDCIKLKTVPEYLMKLTTLKKFDVENHNIEGRYQWETVKDLIKNLNIPMDLVKNPTLPMKWINKNLFDLSIDFQYVDGKQGVEAFRPLTEIDAKGKESLEAFQPPSHIDAEAAGITKIPNTFPLPNIENLKIKCYNGNPTILSWMESLKKLKELRLENCCCLPPLGNLSSLEKLHIKGASVEKVSKDFLAIESDSKFESREMKKWDEAVSIELPKPQYRKESVFPKLHSLELTDMENWEEWEFGSTGSGEEYIKIMPCLRSLRISNCPKLRTLPKYLLQMTISELRLENCVCLPPLGKLSSLERLHIKGAGVEKVSNVFLDWKKDSVDSKSQSPESKGMKNRKESNSTVFPKLESLEFTDMENWEEWEFESAGSGEGFIEIMPCLHSLRISKCPKLRTLPKYLLQMTTLEEYSTSECPILDANYKKERAKGWLKIIKIDSKTTETTLIDSAGVLFEGIM